MNEKGREEVGCSGGSDRARLEQTIQRINTRVGERFKRLRKERGLTQQEVADAVGVTQQQIRNYETGKHRMPLPSALLALDLFRVDIDPLVKDLLDTKPVFAEAGQSGYRGALEAGALERRLALALAGVPSLAGKEQLVTLVERMADLLGGEIRRASLIALPAEGR